MPVSKNIAYGSNTGL